MDFWTYLTHFLQNTSNMRLRSQNASEKETLVLKALDGIEFGKYKSAHAAARELGISPATVYRRLNGHSSRSTARLKQQLLSESQENTLLKWIKQLTSSGYPSLIRCYVSCI